MIKTVNLTKIYKNDAVKTIALKDVSLEIKKGEFIAIMGPSGSGKSTLMHLLGALDTPTSGAYFLEGKDVSKLSDDELSEIRNKNIGFVFQAFNLLPRVTALKNIMIPLVYAGVEKKERIRRAKKALSLVGLEDKLSNRPNQLSGGEIQRVAIARALITNPSVIFADEPTGYLDTKSGEEIMEILQDLNKSGHTIVLVTHEIQIAKFAKRAIYLRDGKVVKDIFNHYQKRANN
ncbi:macrolide ABC transporter ATP-binding protein [Microgenomates group bacterium RBG_19FT_COMBO_39_10]|nr:MAG: macrolide ABC transporter ATP-binding protein [Microgenomates group bacterium RBG_19FT_COMBO_39_10]